MGKKRINKKAKRLIIDHLAFYFVPRPGVEPGRVSPLVFETSASTDSAIWAYLASAKLQNFFEYLFMKGEKLLKMIDFFVQYAEID